MPSSPENKGFGQGDPALARWAEEVFRPEDAVLREIRERSVREELPPIAVGRFDGLHLEVIARAIGALKAVEIGTLGGYSGVCLLRGMGVHGVLHTFEYSEKHAKVASDSFHKAGVGSRAHIHVGPALQTLREVEAEAPFDLVFIDAASSTTSWHAAAASVPPCCRRRKVWRWASRSADGLVCLDHFVGARLAPRAQALTQLGSLAGEDGDGEEGRVRGA